MKEVIISVEDYSLDLGGFSLKNIALELNRQEVFAVLGKTGSGKTLLLESIAGYYRGTKGVIRLNGAPVMDIPLAQRRIGFVYQDYGLFPHMTAAQNIAYGLKRRCVSRQETHRRVELIAELMGISHVLKEYPSILSGGEKQRTALGRALILNPEVLLLDEPFSAMDPVTKEIMYRELERIRQEFSCAILFVTHDFNEAGRLADRIGIMIQGELCSIRQRKDLFLPGSNREVDEFLGICERKGVRSM